MTTYNLSTISLHDSARAVKRPAGTINVTDDFNAREDRLLRLANGIRDEVAFTPLRALGVDEADLHRVAMGMVRLVQSDRDPQGDYAAILGVVRTGINGTTAAPEVV